MWAGVLYNNTSDFQCSLLLYLTVVVFLDYLKFCLLNPTQPNNHQ